MKERQALDLLVLTLLQMKVRKAGLFSHRDKVIASAPPNPPPLPLPKQGTASLKLSSDILHQFQSL